MINLINSYLKFKIKNNSYKYENAAKPATEQRAITNKIGINILEILLDPFF